MSEIEDLNIPEDAAALVLYADGGVAMHLPKMTGDDDAPISDHVLAVAAFSALVAHASDRVEDLITEFENGQWLDEVRH